MEEETIEEEISITADDIITTPAPEAPVTAPPVAAVTKTPAAETPAETTSLKIFPLDTSAAEDTSLTFQPLYSDDYFAYKRLKDPEHAELLNEQGASEMKSFTSWLRDMKDTFAEKASKKWYHEQMHRSYEDVDPEVSVAVEKMAMSSITLNNDIVSETLAEIWARQQQYQTAILIYQKLSLLNPNKSAYFAQKIKELQLLTEKS
jgi:Fe-S cluster biosynthesis and repair protein YggX